MARKPPEFVGFPIALHRGFGPYMAVAKPDARYDDGDTLVFLIDKGWNSYDFEAVRLTGIDAPEVRGSRATPEGALARDHLLRVYLPLDTPALLYTEKDRDRWGRYVATVFIWQDGRVVCVNTAMVADGFATARPDWGWDDVVALAESLVIRSER